MNGDSTYYDWEKLLFSQKTQSNGAKSSQNKAQKFAALSLNKVKPGVSDSKLATNKTYKRLSDEKKSVQSNKKSKLEPYQLEDSFLDHIDLTQALNNQASASTKPTPNRSDLVDEQTLELDSSQLSQFFKSTQVLHQIDSIESQETSKFVKSISQTSAETCTNVKQVSETSRHLKPVNKTLVEHKSSENAGDVLNESNREKIDLFFNQIEHSVSVMGTDVENQNENVTKLLEALFSTQTANLAIDNNLKVDTTVNNDDLHTTLSTIDSSFASALKQVFLSNASKSVKKIHNATLVQENGGKFTECGPYYGLPLRVRELIKLYKGIDELYDWQDECLKLPAIENRKNLIYALPTSGGKTLVAEILMLREIICCKRNALFILPFVAIVQEKVWALSPFAVALDFLVEEYAASKGGYPPRKRRRKNSIYIATIEKALGLLNSLVEAGRVEEIGLIVADELHLVGEQGRGSTLEALLTKIMFIKADIQIVGMSATIGNVNDLCNFLNADIYSKNFRPVELVEYVKCGEEIAKINYSKAEEDLLTVTRTLHSIKSDPNTIDPDKLGVLVMEVVPSDSCLIFCASKKNCENVAYLLCRVLSKSLIKHKKDEKEQVRHALKDEGGSLCKILSASIPFGVAYHHSGLTSEERRVIEDAFRAGIISVICCTSTLAAGVNLPAKRVILRQPYVGREFISLSKYKQMVGRAGRAGLGEVGDSILICTTSDLGKVKKLLMAPMDEALSSLHDCEGKGLRHLLLSCISLGIANTRAQLQEVSKHTMLSIQSERLGVNLKKLTDKAIGDLFKLGALQEADLTKKENNIHCNVTVKMENSFSSSISDDSGCVGTGKKRKIVLKSDTKLVISKLGCAAIKGNFELTRAHMLYDDLHQAQKSLVLLDSLHLLYLVTPYEVAEQIRPNKNDYYNIYCRLGPNELQTARILGINESVALKMLSNQPIKNIPERDLNRFYLALMLSDLWNEKSVFDVSEIYQINRGIVQNLMTGAATFASNVVNFCEGLEEFWTFAHLLKGMSQRLSHCCVRELLPLMELPAVKQSRAKQLFNAGYKSVRSIAAANADALVESIEYMPRRVAKQLIAAAKMLLLEKVENLREEAEDVLEGVDNPKPFFNQTFLD